MYLPEDLTWPLNSTALVKKAQYRLYFLRSLKKHNLNMDLLVPLYHCSTEGVLIYCSLVSYSSGNMVDKKTLERFIKVAQVAKLSTLEDTHGTGCLRRTSSIAGDPRPPCHHLFTLLPAGISYKII